MTTESNIVHEAGLFWVCRDTANRAYTVYRIAATHSSADSSYALTPDGLSIAITRCNYLAKRFPDQAAIDQAQAESKSRAKAVADLQAMQIDHWGEGYRAGLSGQTYADNPHEGLQGATPWAFGCSQGMRDRNGKALQSIIAGSQACQS